MTFSPPLPLLSPAPPPPLAIRRRPPQRPNKNYKRTRVRWPKKTSRDRLEVARRRDGSRLRLPACLPRCVEPLHLPASIPLVPLWFKIYPTFEAFRRRVEKAEEPVPLPETSSFPICISWIRIAGRRRMRSSLRQRSERRPNRSLTFTNSLGRQLSSKFKAESLQAVP